MYGVTVLTIGQAGVSIPLQGVPREAGAEVAIAGSATLLTLLAAQPKCLLCTCSSSCIYKCNITQQSSTH